MYGFVLIICSEMSTPYTFDAPSHRSRRSVNPKPQPASSTVAPRGSARPKSRSATMPLVAHRVGGRPEDSRSTDRAMGRTRWHPPRGRCERCDRAFRFRARPDQANPILATSDQRYCDAAPPGERRALAIRLERGVAYINGHADVPDANSFAGGCLARHDRLGSERAASRGRPDPGDAVVARVARGDDHRRCGRRRDGRQGRIELRRDRWSGWPQRSSRASRPRGTSRSCGALGPPWTCSPSRRSASRRSSSYRPKSAVDRTRISAVPARRRSPCVEQLGDAERERRCGDLFGRSRRWRGRRCRERCELPARGRRSACATCCSTQRSGRH